MSGTLVVGGGPAGLAAAIHAAGAGVPVTLLERNDRPGVKLLATGGGHCNVANLSPLSAWPELFGRQGRFIVPALRFFDREKLTGWLAELGVPLASPDGFHLFPADNSARSVRDALVAAATRRGVRLVFGARVDRLLVEGGRIAGAGAGDAVWRAERVVLAAGGASYPATGSTGDGVALAEAAGHSVTPLHPGLVGLRVANLDPGLAGLVLPDAAVSFRIRKRAAREGRGDLLLTHGGVSGPAVLDVSGEAVECLEAVRAAGGEHLPVAIRWNARMDADAWRTELDRWRRERGGTPPPVLLRGFLPQRLARWLCARSGVPPDAVAASLPAAARDRLAANLGSFPARVTGSEGWERAMITRGGVALRDVKPDTLESVRVAGLRFAGEVLDVDGPCGGYNLHWAFASGALAGSAGAPP